ncbi:MAG TPA: hypothetical protein VFV53_03115 [Candidatus Limnocylindrales bacterium]|nr:hypothetical protein [Candidatus Limnocylindrales bacterium]
MDEVLLGPEAGIPVVLEGLDVGVPDAPMVLGPDRPDLEPLRQRRIRERLVERPGHQDAVVVDDISGGRSERGDLLDLEVGPAVEHVRPVERAHRPGGEPGGNAGFCPLQEGAP